MTSLKSLRVLFGLITTILLLLCFLTYSSLDNLIDDAQLVNRTNIILRELEKVISYVKDGETAYRGYQLTADPIYLQPYHNSKWIALSKVDMVDSLLNHPSQKGQLDTLRGLVSRHYELIKKVISTHGDVAVDSLLYAGHQNMMEMRQLVNRMQDTESVYLRQKTSSQKYGSQITPLLIFVSILFAILVIIFLFSQVYKSLKTKVKTEEDLENNLLKLSDEMNEKKVAQESLQKVLHSSASTITFLKAVRDQNNEIIDFEIVMSNGEGRLLDNGTYQQEIGESLLQLYPGTLDCGLFDCYVEVVNTGEVKKKEVFYDYEEYDFWLDVSAAKLDDGCVVTSTDITERKRDAELIRESQRKFEAVFNQTFQFIGILDPSGYLLDANQTALDFAGSTRKEIFGKYIWENPWWGLSEAAQKEVKLGLKMATRGEFVRSELEITGKNNQVLPVDFSLKPIKDDRGAVIMIILEGRDLSQIKKSEEERSFVTKLNLIIANSNSFEQALNRVFQQILERFELDYGEVWLPDDGTLVLADPFSAKDTELHQLHNFSSSLRLKAGEDIPGRVITTNDVEYIKDLRIIDEKLFSRKKIALQLGLTTAFAVPVVFNGELLLVSVFFSKRKIDEIEDMIAAIHQISSSMGALLIKKKTQDEIRKSNVLLAAAESMAKIGSWEWNLPLNKMKWSRGVYELHGQSPNDYVPSYEAFFKFIHEDDRKPVEHWLRQAFRDNVGYKIEYRIQLKSGEIRHHIAQGTPTYDHHGEIAGYYGTVKDVSQQRQYERDLIVKNEELVKSNENLEQFAYVASHDLQEPLRKIRAFGDRLTTLYNGQLDNRGKDYIERMQSAAERMQSLIDDLLKYSRVARNIREFKTVNINEVINGVLQDLEVAIAEREAEIHVNDLPDIKGDEPQLRQLFQNLISNSIKFTPQDRKPYVSITGNNLQGMAVKKRYGLNSNPSINFAEINISDQGIGFNAKYSNRIFNIFERLHGRNEFKGTGIGLAICQKVVQNHNGLIAACSEEGQGATFTVVLPIDNNTHGLS